MNLVLNIPEPGQLVDVRQRRYVVVDVAQNSPSHTQDTDHLSRRAPGAVVQRAGEDTSRLFLIQLRTLPAKEMHQVVGKTTLLLEDPMPDGKVKRQLTHVNRDLYRLRSGLLSHLLYDI